MRGLARALGQLDDWVNPIAVKELRQAVQSKFLTGLLVLFLVGQLFTMGVAILTRDWSYSAFTAGRDIFVILFGILAGTCLLFLPVYAAARLIIEHSGSSLIFSTTLRARSIVWGKLLSGLVLTVLIYSACMPFITLTYLLRGIDLPTIFILLLVGFFASAVTTQFAIFLAFIPLPRQVKPVLGLIALGAGVMALVGVIEFMSSVLGQNWRSWDTAEALRSLVFVGVGSLLAIGMFFVLSLAIISPRSANRALPVRAYFTFMWIISLVAVAIWSLGTTDIGPVRIWLVVWMGLMSLALLIAVCEREVIGPRVARRIPRSRLRRGVAFLLYSGAAGGVVWACLMLVLSVCAAYAWHAHFVTFVGSYGYVIWVTDTIVQMGGASLYIFAYCMTGLLIRRTYFPKTPPSSTLVAATLVAAGAFLLPMLVFAATSTQYAYAETMAYWHLGTPMILTDHYESYRALGLFVAAIWAGLGLVLNAPWVSAQAKAFRRYEAKGDAA